MKRKTFEAAFLQTQLGYDSPLHICSKPPLSSKEMKFLQEG